MSSAPIANLSPPALCRCISRITRATVRAAARKRRSHADPYNRENVERVRRDEEYAQREEQAADERLRESDRESRIAQLRRQRDERANGGSADAEAGGSDMRTEVDARPGKTPRVNRPPSPPVHKLHDEDRYTKEGHINYWAHLEGAIESESERRGGIREREQDGARLGGAPEMQPWYAAKDLRSGREQRMSEDQKVSVLKRESTRKSTHDPLNAMSAFLEQKKAARASKSTVTTGPQAGQFFRGETRADRTARVERWRSGTRDSERSRGRSHGYNRA